MTFDQFGIHIGSLLYIRYYGIILVSGAFLGAYLASLEARRRGQNPDYVWDAVVWALIGGIIGARLWHILTPPPSMVAQGQTTAWYLSHPLDAIAVWRGGLGIPGGVAGGVLALWVYCRKSRLDFRQWLDIATPAVPLAQAIGRWGNFVNRELYGRPTDLPWAIHIEPAYRVPGFEQFETFHPTFLYESIWNLGVCIALLWIARRFVGRLRTGDLFLAYLILYPVGRFLVEFIRLDSAEIGTLNANQNIVLIVAVVSAAGLLLRHRRKPAVSAEAVSG